MQIPICLSQQKTHFETVVYAAVGIKLYSTLNNLLSKLVTLLIIHYRICKFVPCSKNQLYKIKVRAEVKDLQKFPLINK